MFAWRLTLHNGLSAAFDGKGSSMYGGRWNRVGLLAVYVSETVALAALEILVHADRDLLQLPYSLYRVTVPDSDIEDLPTEQIPVDWNNEPPPASTVALGSNWLEKDTVLALRVPSVVSPIERNLMLNPLHPHFATLQIEQHGLYRFDTRLAPTREAK